MKNYIFLIVFILFIFLFVVVFSWRGIYLPIEPNSQREIIFAIEKGQRGSEISFNLNKEGLIRSGFLFRFYTYSKGISKKLQAGQYLLSPSMTTPEITEKFVSGDVIKEKITIMEGWNKNEIANYLEDKGIVQAEDFLEKTKLMYWKDKYDFFGEIDGILNDRRNYQPGVGDLDLDVDGYLFPDTYFIEKGISAEKIIEKMLDNFDKKLILGLREEISRQGKTIFEIVTMASMIEREVKTFEDKNLVSGILWKRLKTGMPLQVDATITYITGKKIIKIPLEDLQIDSPYNTYKYKGLPLGPICNPGLDSVKAAIEPEYSDYWYYLSTPEGKTIFSKTLEEHNLAKAKYLK